VVARYTEALMAACEAIAVAIEEYDKMETISFEAFERFPRDQKPEAPEIFFGRRAPALQLATSQALSFVIDHAERLPQLARLPEVSRVLAELRGSGIVEPRGQHMLANGSPGSRSGDCSATIRSPG